MDAALKDFISAIKKHGLAKPNRFHVRFHLPQHLSSTLSAQEGESKVDSVNSGKGRIQRETKQPPGGLGSARILSIMAQSISLPGVNLATNDTNVGYSRKIVYDKQQNEFDVVFTCTRDMIEKKVFEEWIHLVVDDTHRIEYYDNYVGNIEVEVYGDDGQPTYKLVLVEAYPTVVNPVSLDRSASNSTLTFQATFVYRKANMGEPSPKRVQTAETLNLAAPPVVEQPQLSLPPAPPTDNTALFLIDIYKNIERVKKEIENGMDPESAARIIRRLTQSIRAATGIGSDAVDKAIEYVNDILFVLGRKNR